VIVKQFQTPKPYSGQSSHGSFREHFERVAKVNGWVSEQEKMQNLALALEGPAVECLKEVKEEEQGAYSKLWAILAHRFGYLDEPERAMRKFDTRRQLDGESVAEYEQALRTLYREAWPKADEVTRDAALKRKFEEGLGSGEMLQFLRLHARQDDFGQTVAKARRFAETQEAVKPKKAVRILEAPDWDHNAESIQVGSTSFQPLLDGFKEVIQTVLQDRTQPTVGCVPSLKINQVRVGVVTPETLQDGTNALARQLLATAASAQTAMAISSISLGTVHTAQVQGLTKITGRDVRPSPPPPSDATMRPVLPHPPAPLPSPPFVTSPPCDPVKSCLNPQASSYQPSGISTPRTSDTPPFVPPPPPPPIRNPLHVLSTPPTLHRMFLSTSRPHVLTRFASFQFLHHLLSLRLLSLHLEWTQRKLSSSH